MEMEKPSPHPAPLRAWLVCLSLFCGTLLLFSRAVPHDFLDLDDGDYVTANPPVQAGLTWTGMRWALTASVAANWHPLTLISHMLDCQLFGANPHGPHAVNVFWHAMNAVLVFLVLRRLTGAFWASAVSAALFAWHPLRVESVAWIAERKDVLSVFFGLLALWSYAVYAERRHENVGGAGRFYVLTLACFTAGLLCKPMLVTLPFLLLLLDWWPLQRFSGGVVTAPELLRLGLEKIPFLLLSAAASAVTYFVQRNAGAVGATFPLPERLANAAVAVARYLGKFFWPFDLAVGYPLPARWPAGDVMAAVVLLLALTGLALWQWRRRPWLFVGWFWFLGALVPVLGLVQAGLQSMADRYTYLPILGWQLALVWTAREICRSPAARRWLPVAVAVLLAGGALRTWNQLGAWRDSRTLYEHALAVTRGNYLAHFYLGTTCLNETNYAGAEAQFRRALALKPDFTEDHYRLGVVLEKMGRPAEAAAVYQAVLRDNPGYGIADYSLGELFLEQDQPAAAVPYLRAALKIKPDYAPACVALGSALAELGRPAEAVTSFNRALALNPRNPPAHYDCANALMDLRRFPEALAHYQAALRLDPDFAAARCNCGNALRALGRDDEACAQYRLALQLRPSDANAHYGLGAALEDSGRLPGAMASYREAVRLNPHLADARRDLGILLVNQHQPAGAETQLQAAVELRPDDDQAWLALGLAEAQLGRQTNAVADYRRALACNPDNADALCCLGVALRRQGRLAEAIPCYEHALELKPDDAEAHAELGNALFQTGHAAEAIPHLELALKWHPDFPGVSAVLAQARKGQAPDGK